jgi:exosortase K
VNNQLSRRSPTESATLSASNYILSKAQVRDVQLILLIVSVVLPITFYCDTFWRYCLCLPSAGICSVFLDSTCTATAEGYLLTNPVLTVHVTRACSAEGFLILLFSLISCAAIRSLRFTELLKLIWIFPLAYGITILANSARIIAGWATGRLARAFLPEHFWSGIHLGTGIVIFLTCLIITYLLLKWRLLNGHQPNQTAHQ